MTGTKIRRLSTRNLAHRLLHCWRPDVEGIIKKKKKNIPVTVLYRKKNKVAFSGVPCWFCFRKRLGTLINCALAMYDFCGVGGNPARA